MDYMFKCIEDNKPFNNNFIRDLNQILAKWIFNGGNYQNNQVYITGSNHTPPSSHEVYDLMENLINKINVIDDKLTIKEIAEFHLYFE